MKNLKDKILIVVPTYSKYYHFLPIVLEAIDKLIIPDGYIANCFVITDKDFECSDVGKKNSLGWTDEKVILMAKKRNLYHKIATESRYDWILNIDGDVVVKEDTLVKLLAAKKKCISGWVYDKKQNGKIVSPDKIKYGEIYEVHSIGTYCMLEHRDIFSKVGFREMLNPADDTDRCGDIRMMGYTVYCHPEVYCKHLINNNNDFKPNTN